MTSVQRYLPGHLNEVREATLAASSVRASTAIERVAATRAGGGRVRLEGAYTGHEAADIDVEIVAAGGVPRASVPTFAGVGNGTMAVEDVDGAAPLQALIFTLTDLGVLTEHARLDVREVSIRARDPGAVGNSIRLTVTPALTATTTGFALLADWQAGTSAQIGEQWDFGGLPLSATGQLDPASPRIRFGFDPQVYRAYREYKDGAWRHGLSPALERTVTAGTRVWTVSGGYDVEVTDGVSVETYAGVVSFFDLLVALSASAMVEVAGVIAADRLPGGQAAIDVPLRTSAWLFALSGKVKLQQVSVPASAPTQALTVKCINADVVGAERWSVAGAVSGELATAVTGQLYTSAAASFLVPTIAPATADSGEWGFKYEPTSRSDEEGVPSVCVRPFRFGRNAKARTVTFRYQKRPPPDCKCSDMPTPRLSMKCLGLEEDMSTEDPEYLNRVKAVYAWREVFIRANTEARAAATTFVPGAPGTPGTPEISYYHLTVSASGTFSAGGLGVYGFTVQAYVDSELPDATAADAAVAAISGAVIPSGAALNSTITLDGYPVKIVSIGTSSSMGLPGSGLTTPEDATVGSVAAQHVTDPGTPGSPGTPGYTVARSLGFLAYMRDLDWMESTIPILLSCLADVYGHSGARVLWDALWTEVQADLAVLNATADDLPADQGSRNERFLDRYRATCDNILLEAGILPKSSASSDAGGCWRDYPDESYWWADVDGYYLPAFSNKPYISARRNTETGKPYSTMEFGFGLVVACPERLKVGDSLTISILVVDGERPYQVGDEAVIETVAAGPAWLAGGIDGTDELTWQVAGSESGPLPDYVVPLAGPVSLYEQAGVGVRITPGGIPFALGDRFDFAVEAGQFRWRRDAGAWSTVGDIPAGGVAVLADGVSAVFLAGAAPSFVPDDLYTFRVHQPYAVSHVRNPDRDVWGWAGAAGTLDIDFGALRPISSVALARYVLPAGAAVSVEWSDDGLSWSAPLALDVGGPVAVAFFDEVSVRYLRVNVADAAGGAIALVWAGVPLVTTYHATTCQRARRWRVSRGGAPNAAGLYAGRGDGWALSWEEVLMHSDAEALLDMADWMQSRDEPIVFVPHYEHPSDAALVTLGSDALELPDYHEYQPNNAEHRRHSASLTLEPVLA